MIGAHQSRFITLSELVYLGSLVTFLFQHRIHSFAQCTSAPSSLSPQPSILAISSWGCVAPALAFYHVRCSNSSIAI